MQTSFDSGVQGRWRGVFDFCCGRKGRRASQYSSGLPSEDSESSPSARPSLRAQDARSLGCAIFSMAAAGHVQYSWTLFVLPYQHALSTNSASLVQGGFSIFVIFQTSSVLLLGLVASSRRQPRTLGFAGLCLLTSFLGLSAARSIALLYVSCALAGIGVGSVYNVCVSISVRVYPARRGLSAGIVAGAYGAGTLPTIAAIEKGIRTIGPSATLRVLAGCIGGTVLCCAALLPSAAADGTHSLRAAHSLGPRIALAEACCLPIFWTLYLMLVLISFVGLIITAQLQPLASAYGIGAGVVVSALQLDRVLNGLSRPCWGWLSDSLGRAHALGLAFALQTAVLLAWAPLLSEPSAFVAFSALSTFSWGEIYSLFPALAADLFGAEHIGQTYGALYTGKAVASVLAGPVASSIAGWASWKTILYLMAAAAAFDAFLALVVLKRQAQRAIGIASPVELHS